MKLCIFPDYRAGTAASKNLCSSGVPQYQLCFLLSGRRPLICFYSFAKKGVFGPRTKIKSLLKILWDKNVNSQSPLHNVENHMSIGLQVASESSSEGMLSVYLSALTHPCNVLIKTNITRKRFDAGYSNLEHWSYLMPSTIRPDMTSLAISGHVSAAIL